MRVVVSTIQIVESRLGIVVISTVTEGVIGTEDIDFLLFGVGQRICYASKTSCRNTVSIIDIFKGIRINLYLVITLRIALSVITKLSKST